MAKSIDLFLSHNNSDKPWTERLAAAVEADRSGPPLRVFFDKWDIPYGGDIPAELEEGLQNSRYVGVVLSPESLASDWVTLERSTAICRDPKAREHSLLPLLRRECDVPDMLARLKYIDFRREQDFDAGLDVLVSILRGRAPRRGDDHDAGDVYFREDAALLKQHRRIFNRPAFRVPCVTELSLGHLVEALCDTVAAINTGTLFSRSGRLLLSFSDQSEYRQPEFKQAFSRITDNLITLQQELVELHDSAPAYRRPPDPNKCRYSGFYSMLWWCSRGNVKDAAKVSDSVKALVRLMDSIDQRRNEILDELNVLLSKCGEDTFTNIKLSSAVINENRWGCFDDIASLLR